MTFTARLDNAQERRGFLEACKACPLHLTCATGRPVQGYWCARCMCVYIPSLKQRVSCDALDIKRALRNGMCPCESGVPVPTIKGYQLIDGFFDKELNKK